MKMKLLGKVLTFTLIPVIIGITALAYLSSSLASRGLYAMADIQLLEFANKQASEIDNVMNNVIALGDMLDSTDGIENLSAMANKLGQQRNTSPEFIELQKQSNHVLAEVVEDFDDISVVVLVAKDGKTIAASNSTAMNYNVFNYPSVISAFNGTSKLETRVSQATKKMSAMFATPVTADGTTNRADAVLLLVVDLANIADDTIRDVKLMPSSNIFLLNSDGIMLMERAFPELIGKDNTIYEYVRGKALTS